MNIDTMTYPEMLEVQMIIYRHIIDNPDLYKIKRNI